MYKRNFVPYIPMTKYDEIAHDFLETFYPDALREPMPVPIENVAKDCMGLNIKYLCLSEEHDIYGMTVFTDGMVEIYNLDEGLYDLECFKAKTILIDPEAVKRTNIGCKNNTIAHECIHWYKHRYYYKMQALSLPKYAKYCRCRVNHLPTDIDAENIMETQAIGIAPRILMPSNTFAEVAANLGVSQSRYNYQAIDTLADFFVVSRQSVKIRLKELGIL